MKVYVVLLDDYDAGWPEAIFDKSEFAIEFANKISKNGLSSNDYCVLEYDLNNIDNGYKIQEIYSTSNIK